MADLSILCEQIKTEANRLGFNHVGVASALPAPHIEAYRAWVKAGRHAGMAYLSREDSLSKRQDPRHILPGCQSIICLAMPYFRPTTPLEAEYAGKGRVSTYAQTRDYHKVIWQKLEQLEKFIHEKFKEPVSLKSYVDTGPILERNYANRAGIGIAGKNSCLIIQGVGSFFFLAEILTDLPLPADEPFTRDLCGSCRRCIEACPTACIREDRTLESGRCISYLTIEHKGIIPDELKDDVGSWVFGCDVCQMVCPHNALELNQTIPVGEYLLPEHIDLISLLEMDQENFLRQFGPTPLSRAKHCGMLRNAAIVLGNQRCVEALPALRKVLSVEQDPAVIDACQWAIRQIEDTNFDS